MRKSVFDDDSFVYVVDVCVLCVTALLVMLIGYAVNLNRWGLLGLAFCFVAIPVYVTHNFLEQVSEARKKISTQSMRNAYVQRQSIRAFLIVVIILSTLILVFASIRLLFFWGIFIFVTMGFLCIVIADIFLGDRVVKENDSFIRGRRLISQEQAQENALATDAENPFSVFFAGLFLPHEAAYEGFMELGTVGAGKSKVIQALIASAFPLIGMGYSHRAVVLAPKGKGEVLPVLHEMGLACPIHNLNPFLNPSVGVDIIGAISDPAMAFQVGEVLVPKDANTSQPYFARTGGSLLGAVLWAVKVLTPSEEKATLRHALLIMRYRHRIEQVLDQCEDVRHVLDQHIRSYAQREQDLNSFDPRVQSVISETAGKTGKLEPIAAALEQSEHMIDLEDWINNQESVLVLGTSYRRMSAMAAYNRVIITLLATILLDGEEIKHTSHPYARTWFILDEFPSLQEIEVIPDLLSQGRTKGGCPVLTFQSISQIIEHYREIGTRIILDCINNKVFLRVLDPKSEKLVEEELGIQDVSEIRVSSQYDSSGNYQGSTESEHRETRPNVLASEVGALPLPSRKTGIFGFAKVAGIGCYPMIISGKAIDEYVPSRTSPVSLWYTDQAPEKSILKDLSPIEKKVYGISDPPREDGDNKVVATKVDNALPGVNLIKQKRDSKRIQREI